jgi:hypothetical protein
LLVIGHTSLWKCWPSAARALARQDEKRCCSEHARPDGVRRLAGKRGSPQLSKLRKQKGRHSSAPKGITSSTTEENFGFWIDEATKVVTLADGKKLNVGRFDDRWISAVSGDVSYELDRQNGNLTYAGSTMKDGIATTIIDAGRCTVAAAPAR